MPEYHLVEYEKQTYRPGEAQKSEDPERIPEEIAQTLWNEASTQVDVEFPSLKTGGKITLTNKGYTGHVQLPDGHTVVLEPKIEVEQVLRLFRYAEGLEALEFLDRLYDSDTVESFYDNVVEELARGVIRRQRKGLHQEYVSREEKSEIIRGRIDFRKSMAKPWDPNLYVGYSELTPDIEDNRILLWTLFVSRGSGLVSEEVMIDVRRAYQSLTEMVSLERHQPSNCLGRTYQRLNQGYERLHVLCYIILSHSGPVRGSGDKRMVPWAIDMETLYERVVANWLTERIGGKNTVEAQEQVEIGDSGRNYDVDLVFYRNGNAVAVADTKYKTPSKPSTDDISQVISYAEAKGVDRAYLVYPEDLPTPINTRVGDISVGTLTFGLEGDLHDEGDEFLRQLSSSLGFGMYHATASV